MKKKWIGNSSLMAAAQAEPQKTNAEAIFRMLIELRPGPRTEKQKKIRAEAEAMSHNNKAAKAAKAATAANNRKEARNRIGVRKLDIISGKQPCFTSF